MAVATKYKVGHMFNGWYDGKERNGVIHKVAEKFIVVETREGYRTFVIAKIQ
jgi:hypothetical protein